MIGWPYENVAKCVISVSISLRFKILFWDYVIFIKILYLKQLNQTRHHLDGIIMERTWLDDIITWHYLKIANKVHFKMNKSGDSGSKFTVLFFKDRSLWSSKFDIQGTSSFSPVDYSLSQIVHFCRPSIFADRSSARPLWTKTVYLRHGSAEQLNSGIRSKMDGPNGPLRAVQFHVLRPSSFIDDGLFSDLWTVLFYSLGPYTLSNDLPL